MGTVCMILGWLVLVQSLPLLCLVQPIPGISSTEGTAKGRQLADCSGLDPLAPGNISVPRTEMSTEDIYDDEERYSQAAGSLSLPREMPITTDIQDHCLCGPPAERVCIEIHVNHGLFVSTGKPSCPPCTLTGIEEDVELRRLCSPTTYEKNILKTTSEAVSRAVHRKIQCLPDHSYKVQRVPQEPSVTIASFRSRDGPRPHGQRVCATERASPGPVQCTCPADDPYILRAEISFCTMKPLCSSEDMELLPETDHTEATATMGAPTGGAISTQTCGPISCYLTFLGSATGLLSTPSTRGLSASQPGPPQPCLHIRCQPGAVPMPGPPNAMDTVIHHFPETNIRAPQNLAFRVQMASEVDQCLEMDFGDSFGIQMRIRNMSEEMAITTYHQYRKEGVYMLKAAVYNELYETEVELGPYYVEVSHVALSVYMNSSSVHGDEDLVFAASPSDEKSTVVMHHFPSISSYNVSFRSQTQGGDSQAWSGMTVWYQMQPVSVYTLGTVFAADTDITFTAITKETTRLEFLWYFGNGPPVRTTTSNIKKRFSIPKWYLVMVRASNGVSSTVSEPRHIRVQKRIVANRLVSTSSALVNASVTFECRINFGTDVAYLWNFGDGVVSLGSSSTSHVYSREGEFTVEVLAFNNVSTVSLRKHLFIVQEPCQPPPVKNMGPERIQVWRSQPIKLGVTFEAAVLCDISSGISYTWSFRNSAGWLVPLPPAVRTHRQTITVPSYFLEPGNYTALAKVQVEGSIVYSNYSVGVEVRSQAPVSVISEGTHLFVSRTRSSTIVLRGSQSYDPDIPGAILRYHWKCTVASMLGHPCFAPSSPCCLDTSAPILVFAANSLSDSFDQFLVTLTVSSNVRNSSEAQVFLSTRSDPVLRFIHISRVNFKDIFVGWNEELSFQAECEACDGMLNLSYSWDLFLVNATEKNSLEVPFCRTVGHLGSSGLGSVSKLSEIHPLFKEPNRADVTVLPPWELLPKTPDQPTLATSGSAPTETMGDFEAYYSDIQEAMPSKGRHTGTNLPGSEPSVSADGGHSDGDNLVGPYLPTVSARPTLLVDWPKSLLNRAVFHGYTSSGIMEHAVTVQPYSLDPGETYVLQASVASKHRLLGKAQLYLTVKQAPGDVSCQVQPPRGLEAHTIFSIFCMSGRPDFLYEFSYGIGNTSKHTLYSGRDTQYYFALPAGDPVENYKVMVSIQITDSQGSQGQPCTVEVTVLPRFHSNHCPEEDIYNSSLRNLSTLQLMGSYTEIRNYIMMITKILSRWTKENRNLSCGQWSQIQDAFISTVCRLALQEEMIDSILILRELIHFPNKLSFRSAVLILKHSQTLLERSWPLGRFVVDKRWVSELILLVTGVLEVSDQEKSRNADYLREEGTKVILDLLVGYLCLKKEPGLHVSTGLMEVCAQLHCDFQRSVQSVGSVQVHLPAHMAGQTPAGAETQSLCYASQLMIFKKNPYPGRAAPGQVGPVVALSLHNCSSRRPISSWRLREPIMVEFGEEDSPDNGRNKMTFVLLRDKVNFHQFTGHCENPLESLHIRIEFSKPIAKAFPVLLLVRFSEKPTPSNFLVKQIYFWDENIVHIYLPALSQKDANLGYLSLLDADYNRNPVNKYFAKAVNYTVHFQWIQCLFWDMKEWKSGRFSPQPGTVPEKVNCSYDHLATFAIGRRKLNTSFEMSDISKFQRHPENLLPGIFVVVLVILYALFVTKSRCVDRREKKKTGYIFLQENTPPSHQLYAVVVDTGFRAPSRFSAKVYIVLCGENGLSEPKELCYPEKPLFESNSRHTFILSVSAMLGPLQKIHLWHDSRGPSPAWYVSHVMVKELCTQEGQCWFFPAECWLAVSRVPSREGRVEQELTCLQRGPGFRKLFYSKFTEYLEDFHVWVSVYSRPSSSGFLHTPRLTVAFTLLCSYACLTALVTSVGQDQLLLGVDPTNITLGSFQMGFLCTLLASSGAQLLSLLFRLSKEAPRHSRAPPYLPRRRVQTGVAQDPNFQRRIRGAQKTHEENPLAILSESTRAWRRVTSSDEAGCLSPELEGCGADPCQQTQREKRDHDIPGSHRGIGALGGEFEGHAMHWWPKAPLLWSGSAAWAICGMVSVVCGLGTGFLGYRFDSTQCVQWLHLLTVSVVCCVLLTQPLMIGIVALCFAWKRKNDKHFFSASLHAATKDLDAELEGPPGTCSTLSSRCRGPNCASEIENLMDARQQARRLHWACPVSKAQLQVIRARMRRQMRAQVALRDIPMYIFMLLLLFFIVYGKFSRDEYSLNRAIRNEFACSSSGLRSMDDWWHWSLSTLLDGLYWESSAASAPHAQPGALGGKCYQLGTLVIKQLKVLPGSSCELPSPFSTFTEDSLPTCSLTVGGSETSSSRDPEIQRVASSDRSGCRETCELSLGSTRPTVHEALAKLRASRWMNRSTRAVSLHFSLYNPPTRLFSSVSLSAEVLPTGGLILSTLVESFTLFYSDSTLWYHLLLPELILLVLGLIHFSFQLFIMIDKGIHKYWRKPRNWLEISIVGTSLAYYIAWSHLVNLAGEVKDHFQKGVFQGFMDLSHMASWNQVRWLQGILSFFLILKCTCLLGIEKTWTPCSFMRHCSFSSIFAPVVVGILMLASLSHLHGFLLFTCVLPSGTFSDSFHGLLFHFPGRSQSDTFHSLSQANQQTMAWCYCIIFIVMATLWLGMMRGYLMIFAPKRKSFQRIFFVRLKDVTSYIWGKALILLGLGRSEVEENEVAEDHSYYLDEFADLVDELLLKINGLSDSLQLPLLEQKSNNTLEAREEDSPLVGVSVTGINK
ncbi:polycystic kidney disease protein 1-like 1 isoform X3 [Talpa occidentalis]|uniref:polycystic kidney disease protein 1-like 1 isoform X3 n=1 Tax=Talpa occidentalis TaxID=50954 RepID=UPI0023F79741|nr:polycystic kidney disease protein 1-like 1 isoform X3 [Talpa occidentalis]